MMNESAAQDCISDKGDLVSHETPRRLALQSRDGQLNTACATSADESLANLRAWASRFLEFAAHLPGSDSARHHFVWALCHEGVALVASAMANAVADERIRDAIAAAVTVQSQSPFARRLQEWPRGYPGDFETIEYLCQQVNGAAPETIGWYIEEMLLNTPIAQQHRNKVLRQATLLAELAVTRPDARVLVVGSGAAPDVRQALPWIRASRMRIVLNDIDRDALDFCDCQLSELGHRVEFLHGNALRCLRGLGAIGTFDLVLCGGLFDYLTDRQVVFLLRQVKRIVSPEGRIFFTNVAAGNPYRPWMEYFANWPLTERGADDLRRLTADADLHGSLRVERDPTALSWLATYTLVK